MTGGRRVVMGWSYLYVLVLCFTSISITASSRKCSGKWKIHACGGGNGKRSGSLPSRPHMSDVIGSSAVGQQFTPDQQQQLSVNDRRTLLSELSAKPSRDLATHTLKGSSDLEEYDVRGTRDDVRGRDDDVRGRHDDHRREEVSFHVETANDNDIKLQKMFRKIRLLLARTWPSDTHSPSLP